MEETFDDHFEMVEESVVFYWCRENRFYEERFDVFYPLIYLLLHRNLVYYLFFYARIGWESDDVYSLVVIPNVFPFGFQRVSNFEGYV